MADEFRNEMPQNPLLHGRQATDPRVSMSKYRIAEERLQKLLEGNPDIFTRGSLIGIEKESLRVTGDGDIVQTPHPQALGSALTHHYITTDFSEALLEFITPPYADMSDALSCMNDIHRFVYANLDDELLWATSMPCKVAGDASVPLAEYGSSNVGTMKNVYRRGLSHRYGRLMQAISGVHFNYSFPQELWPILQTLLGNKQPLQRFVSDSYFALIRNFQRQGWLVPYLFGSSPVVCKSFLGPASRWFSGSRRRQLVPALCDHSAHERHRLQEQQPGELVHFLRWHRCLHREPDARHRDTQLRNTRPSVWRWTGQYRQLNANILQIENEYYSFIRPKRVAHSGEKPTVALAQRGVEYVEVRALDVIAFEPNGFNEEQMRFLEAFLVFCVLRESDPISEQDRLDIAHNQEAVAIRGRQPGLALRRRGRDVGLTRVGGGNLRRDGRDLHAAGRWEFPWSLLPGPGTPARRRRRFPTACLPRACWRIWRPGTNRFSSTPCACHGNTGTFSSTHASAIHGESSSRPK